MVSFKYSSIHFCLSKFSEKILFLENENLIPISYSIENENNLLGTGGAIKLFGILENNFIVQYGIPY